MADGNTDKRLKLLEHALDQALYQGTRSHYHFVKRRQELRGPLVVPSLHSAVVMRAIYAEAASHNDLLAPLAGALSFDELQRRTGLTPESLERALQVLVVEEKRLRTRDEGAGRVYFLPKLKRRHMCSRKGRYVRLVGDTPEKESAA